MFIKYNEGGKPKGKEMENGLQSDGIDRDSGGESGRRARAGRETETTCLSRLGPPRLTVLYFSL